MAIAQSEVTATLASLPGPVRERVRPLPVTYETVPNAAIIADGYEPDLLGLFVGSALDEEAQSLSPLPPQIILFLENLWDFAENDDEIFREEVRVTYLHELGHYLGLDEDDLFDRGLE